MNTVCVMMSTYNGEKYLEEQIDSILNQQFVEIYLFVRDDGSSDGTKGILIEYAEKGRLQWYAGDNLGPAYSFFDLINNVEGKYDYYAFADQDDYWYPEKMSRAVCLLNAEKSLNKVYHSRVDVVNERLEKTGLIFGAEKQYNFVTELLRNNAVGCTFVMSNRLIELIRLNKPQYVCMHDQWIMLVCLGTGGVALLDEHTTMKYRQHGNNSVGVKNRLFQKIKNSTLNWKASTHSRMLQAKELFAGYEDVLRDENLEKLNMIIGSGENWKKGVKCMFFDFNSEKWYLNLLCRFAILGKRV